MSRRRATVAGIQPPNLPSGVTPLPSPVVLSDEDAYSAVLIADAELSGSRATDLSFDQVLCRRVRLAQAELERAQLTDVQLDTCDLAGATLTRPQLRRVVLAGCRLLGTALLDARLEHVLIQRGNGEALRCWNATLQAVRFERCSLRGASFTGSDLSGVVFQGCDLSEADFRDASLRGADLRGSTITRLQVGLRELQGAIVSPAQAVELTQLLGLVVQAEDDDRRSTY